MNKKNFLEMLKNSAYPLLVNKQPDVTFELDGCPASWGLNVRSFLNERFSDSWNERIGPTPWPQRSADITPLYFFYWFL